MDQLSISSSKSEHAFRLARESSQPCIDFLRDLVSLPSPSRAERLACERVQQEMETLGYSDVHIDEMGNVLGRFGNGKRVLAYDAHIDTVGISNPSRWKYDPFRGVIKDGILFGRGASDQKGGLAAVVHGVAIASRLGIPDDITVWVTATVNGEDCVGLAWQYLLRETNLRPDAMIIAMPSHLGVCRGQRGRTEIRVKTYGESTHGSQPDRGRNAIYAAVPIVQGLARLHDELDVSHKMLGRGSLAVTDFSSRSPSMTAIPDEAILHIDRRLTIGESSQQALEQIEALPEIAACDSKIEILGYELVSWRGYCYPTEKVFPAWVTAEDDPCTGAAMATARHVLGREPRTHRSTSSSTGCTTAGTFGIPTIGFGPANEIHAHTVDDQIPLDQLEPAMAFYALFPDYYVAAG